MASNVLKRLWKEHTDFKVWAQNSDLESKKFTVEKDSFEDPSLVENRNQTTLSAHTIQSSIIGLIYPSSEPFLTHALRVKIDIPAGYPEVPPKIYMLTKILHPNIDEKGEICSNQLDSTKTWNKQSLNEVVTILTELIDNPDTSFVINTEMDSLRQSDKEAYYQKLKEMVAKEGIPRT